MTLTALPAQAQTFGAVYTAEVRRLVRQGGLRRGLWATGLVAVAVGAATAGTLAWINREEPITSSVGLTGPVEGVAATVALLLSLAAAAHFGRQDENGTLRATALLVPNRLRLLLGQLTAVATVAGALTGVVALGTGLLSVALHRSLLGLPEMLVGVATASVACALLVTLGAVVGTLSRRPVTAVLVHMSWWIVLPLALLVAGALLPRVLRGLSTGFFELTPTVLLAKATAVGSLTPRQVGTLLVAQASLLAWVAALGVVSAARVRNRDL